RLGRAEVARAQLVAEVVAGTGREWLGEQAMVRRLGLDPQAVMRVPAAGITVGVNVIGTRRQPLQTHQLTVGNRFAYRDSPAISVEQFQIEIAARVRELDA